MSAPIATALNLRGAPQLVNELLIALPQVVVPVDNPLEEADHADPSFCNGMPYGIRKIKKREDVESSLFLLSR